MKKSNITLQDICKECIYRETVKMGVSRRIHMCNKQNKQCHEAIPFCYYSNEQVLTDSRVEQCEVFNQNFKHRFTHLEDCLGFQI